MRFQIAGLVRLNPRSDSKRAIIVRSLLYLSAGTATLVPGLLAIGVLSWYPVTLPATYVSLLGSLTLILASIVQMARRSVDAALFALGGSLAVWTFYLPVDASLVRSLVTDRQLELTTIRWSKVGSSLSVNGQDVSQLSGEELRQIQAAGVRGDLSVYQYHALYGRGKTGRVLLLIQRPVTQTVELNEPDGSTIVYFQTRTGWQKYPENAPILDRTIELAPDSRTSGETSVSVELATGARSGFGIWWPPAEIRKPKP